MFKRLLILVACVLIARSPVFAQTLADRVPEDAILYVGWSGANSMPAAYQQSKFKAFVEATNFRAFAEQAIPAALNTLAAKGDRDAKEFVEVLRTLLAPMWKYPTAIYLGVDMNGQEPMPKAAVICRADKDVLAMQQKLDALLAQAGQAPFPIKTAVQDDLLVLAIGYEDGAAALAGGTGAKALGASTTFANAMAKVGADPVFTFYLDGDNLLRAIDEGIAKNNDPQAMEMWPKVREASGLGGLRRAIFTSGFDGTDWSDRLYVEAPAPRKGLLSVMDAAPLPDEVFKVVPVTATAVAAGSFDPAKFLTDVRTALGEVEPRAQQMMDQGLGAVQMYVGRNLIKDILEPLGEHWVTYLDPTIAGYGFGGMVIVNKLDDATKAQQGINAVTLAINNTLAGQLAREGVTVAIRRVKVGDVNVDYVAVPLISPAWTIKDGYLYVGLYPQVVASAARRAGATGGKSILDNAEFVAMRKRLGVEHASGFAFADLRASVPQTYQTLLLLSRGLVGLTELAGAQPIELVLPPLEDLAPHLAPASAASWSDEQGFYSKSVTPFPGSTLLSGQVNGGAALIAAPVVLAAVALPATARAKMSAQQVRCLSNGRQLGMAVHMYAAEHKGELPADLSGLTKYLGGGRGPQAVGLFTCAEGPDRHAPLAADATDEQFADWVKQNSDWEYLGSAGLKMPKIKQPMSKVMLAETRPHNNGRTINLVFFDGHAESVPAPRAQQLVAETKQALAQLKAAP